MKKLMVMLMVCGVCVLVGAGCSSMSQSDFNSVMNTVATTAITAGTPVAQQYIAQQVAGGKIDATQADALNSGLVALQAQVAKKAVVDNVALKQVFIDAVNAKLKAKPITKIMASAK